MHQFLFINMLPSHMERGRTPTIFLRSFKNWILFLNVLCHFKKTTLQYMQLASEYWHVFRMVCAEQACTLAYSHGKKPAIWKSVSTMIILESLKAALKFSISFLSGSSINLRNTLCKCVPQLSWPVKCVLDHPGNIQGCDTNLYNLKCCRSIDFTEERAEAGFYQLLELQEEVCLSCSSSLTVS